MEPSGVTQHFNAYFKIKNYKGVLIKINQNDGRAFAWLTCEDGKRRAERRKASKSDK